MAPEPSDGAPAPALEARGLRIDPPLLLAPMAGLTHTALRRLLAELGGVGLLSTEMLSARALPQERPDHPFLKRTLWESPLSWQLLVARPEEVAPAVETLERWGAEALDLNLGCPAPQARRRGGGAFLAADLPRARAVVREVRRRWQGPLSAKLRLADGPDEAPVRDLVRLLGDEGADWITVHARFRNDPYGRPARWDWIARVKAWASVPVVGNGGVAEPGDVGRMLAETGCDAVMIGRAAARTPWIFRKATERVFGRAPPGPDPDPAAVYLRFAELLAESFDERRALGRLKEFTHHFAENYAFGHLLASSVQASSCFEQALDRARRFLEENEPRCATPACP
ncbi:tRNA dihydrouridine synthase [Deferrisoma camini]|uniref:tRNA dihydrouridine synthase n=1 Tax=Deferrisoma camini TaxID=1035120 RepID=UPI00046C95FE|nr:tRNA-dihydrouridine synthase family protein [Deferrisoma camini]